MAAASAVREKFDVSIEQDRAQEHDEEIRGYKAAMSEIDFDAAWRFGYALNLDRLVLFATNQRVIPDGEYREPPSIESGQALAGLFEV